MAKVHLESVPDLMKKAGEIRKDIARARVMQEMFISVDQCPLPIS